MATLKYYDEVSKTWVPIIAGVDGKDGADGKDADISHVQGLIDDQVTSINERLETLIGGN